LGNLKRIEKESLAAKAYKAMCSMIFNEELETGAVLSIDDLARQLHVSATPVREALVRLEAEGLVESVRSGQAKVSGISREELLSLYDVRKVLEPYLLVLLSERTKENMAVRQELQDLLDATRMSSGEFFASGDTPELDRPPIKTDHRLGEILAREMNNPFLTRLIALLNNYILRLRLACVTAPMMLQQELLNQLHEEHAAILDAILLGDPRQIEDASRHHLKMSCRRSIESLAGSPKVAEDKDGTREFQSAG